MVNFLIASLALLSIPAVGAISHVSVVPPRWYASDLLMLLPLGACVAVGVRIVDIPRRFVFGLAQAGLLIFVYANVWRREIALGDPYLVFAQWSVLSLGYAGVFAWLTGMIRSRRPRDGPTAACPACGYDLTGNESGTCPECGHVMRT